MRLWEIAQAKVNGFAATSASSTGSFVVFSPGKLDTIFLSNLFVQLDARQKNI